MKQKQQKPLSKNSSIKKSGLQIEGHNVNPVILEIPEDEQSRNNSMIKKMMKSNNSNIHYSGGFKNIDSSKINGCISKSLYRPESKISSQDNLMNENGISKVRSQPKYRDENGGGMDYNNSSYGANTLESKLELLKKDRDNKNYGLLHPKDVYTISQLPSRFQQVSHVQSSLDMINLENIQAKLQAHRKNLQHVQQQYNASRGKNPDPNRYGGTSSMLKTNINIDKEYNEIQMPSDKIYELSKVKMEMEPEQIEFEQLWELKKKNNPKLAEYDAKYQQYLLQKDAKNIIGHTIRERLFQWDKYKQPGQEKVKSKIKPKASRSIGKEKSSGKKKQKQQDQKNESYGPDGLVSIKDLKDVIATRDDKFIASYIFTQLDTDKVGLISKDQFHDYVLSQKHIINGYNIDTKWLFTDLDNFETKRKGMLNKVQLSIFLATLQKISHPSLILTQKQNSSLLNNTGIYGQKQKGPIRCNFPKHKQIFQKLFKALDFNDDNLIKRQQYIQNIYLDADCNKLMDQEVMFIKPIEKVIKYRQIIGFILQDYTKQKNQKLKKSKQYLTFARFCQYFEVPESLDLSRIDKVALKKKRNDSTQCTLFDLPEEYLQLLRDIYNSLPRIYQDFIVSADFVQSALRDPQILALSDELCRIQSIETRVPLETLQTTLHRMQKQCDQYSNWDSLKLFFSRRGRPLDWDYQLIVKKKELRKQKLKQNRSSLGKSKLHQSQEYFQLADRLTNKSQQKILKGPDRYTVPQPFDITDMKRGEKSKQKDLSMGKRQYQQLKKQFKAKPVNKQILQPKPQLIMGKVVKNISSEKEKRPQYKYENYENDRIERALKKAQQEHQKEQALKKIKQKTEIKAFNIGVDLTKKYHEVIKEQSKVKRKENQSKKKSTKPQVSENLYPKNIIEEKAKKLKKAQENIKKLDEIAKRKDQINRQKKEQAKRKNQQNKKIAQQAKRLQKQLQQERGKMQTDKFDFKPKIKKKNMTEQQKRVIEDGRKEREQKRRKQAEQPMLMQEDRRKKRLQYEKKSLFLDIQGMDDEQILDRIDQVNFQDLLLDQESIKQYRKQFDNKGKVLKELKEREKGLAGRERAAMDAEQRRIMQEKRKYKQKLQKQKTDPHKSGSFSRVSEKGQKSGSRNQLDFHRSKALRRYRALMEDKKPQSQWDKYSEFSEGKK